MKRFAIILAVVIAVVAVAIAAVPFVIPSGFLKQRVAERIAALTGRAVTFTGEPSLSIYPHVAIAIDGLSIANPEGMGSDPIIVADTIRTRLRLLPLLVGRAEFDEFELVKPTIHLVVDSQGRRNWGIAGSAVAAEAIAPAPPAGSVPAAARPADVQLGQLILTDGTVLYDNLASNTREQLTGLTLDVNWPSVSATASGRGKFVWRGEPVEFTGVVAAPLQVIRGNSSGARFAIASTPLRASFSGRAATNGGPHLDGDGSISTPSMRRTIEWLGTPMGTGPILGAAAVRGTVSTDGSAVRFRDATIELDGNAAVGALGIDFAGVRPALTGTLSTDKLDLSAYIEAIRADVFATGSWLIAPARLAFAEAVDAEIHLSAGEVVLGGVQAGRTTATVAITDGAFDVAVDEARFYAGTLQTHLRVAPDGNRLAGKAEAHLTGVAASEALAALAGISVVSGTAAVTLNLSARGRNWGEFASAVAGSGEVEVVDGSLAGIDLVALADELADPFAGPVTRLGGVTAFRRLGAGISIAEGNLSSDDLFVDGKDFRLALTGHGSLLSGAVDAKATLTTASETIPLMVAGTWRQPAIARVVTLRRTLGTP